MHSGAVIRAVFSLSLSMAAVAAQAAPLPSAGAKTYDASRLEAEFKRQCSTGEFSGAVIVRAGGREVFSGACGEADGLNHIANTRETRFKIYSTSKFITSLMVMRLVEDGQIGLDAPVSRYLKDAPAAWSAVTVRQLLNHTSGVKDLTETLVGVFHATYDAAMTDTLGHLTPAQAALDTPPGTRFAYNNFGFELLATMVERVTGEPFPKVAQRLVFDPAGMTTASFQPAAVILGHPFDQGEDGLAVGYNGAPGKLVQATNYGFIQMGAGAVRASVDDFVALDQALSEGRIVKPATLQLMGADLITPPEGYPVKGRRFGLGMIQHDIDGVAIQGHTGGTNGYISDFERAPEQGAMMIALTNRGFVKTAWLRTGFVEMLKGVGGKG